MKKNRGDESIGVIIHGNNITRKFLCSYLSHKQAKMSFFSFTKLKTKRVEEVLWLGVGSWNYYGGRWHGKGVGG
jgi:hypothetical protein